MLQDRAAGVLESLDQAAVTGLGAGLAPPGLQIVGPLDVTYDPTTNYAAWQAALSADPDAKAMIGLCGTDLPNLIKLKTANPTSAFIAAGYDLTDAALAGIHDGSAFATIDQTPFMQGYIPVKILADTLSGRSKVDLRQVASSMRAPRSSPRTAWSSHSACPRLTLDEREAFVKDPAAARAYYQPAIEGTVEDWPSLIRPLTDEVR